MIKTVIYDLDGTLLDTLSTIADYANQAMAQSGLKQFEINDYKYFIGNGAKKLVERMLTAANVSLETYFEPVFQYYNTLYDSAPLGKTAPYEGIPELVQTLAKRNIKQAVLSNKPDIAAKGVMAHFFTNEFDRIYGGRPGIPLKPEPQPLLALLEELDTRPEECLYVGDTLVDMQTGKHAGAVTVGVLWGFRDRKELEENGADYIVATPAEILDVIAELK